MIALLFSDSERASADAARSNLLLQTVVHFSPSVPEGQRVLAVLTPFLRWTEEARKDPAFLQHATEEQLCNFLAGAWELDGWKPTVTSPGASGRRQIIVEKHGFGSIRMLDQPLVVPADHFVTPNDIAPLLSELGSAAKGYVSTTSSFDPSTADCEGLKQLIPNRLELRDGAMIRQLIDGLQEGGQLGALVEMNASTPRGYFERYIRPSLGEWKKEPDDLRRATTLAGHLNSFIDRLFLHDSGGIPPTRTLLNGFRDSFATKCPEFAIVRDMADTEKHVVLSRQSKKVSSLEQVRRTGAFSRGFSSGFDIVRIVVSDDTGIVHEFDDLVPVIVASFEAELIGRGL